MGKHLQKLDTVGFLLLVAAAIIYTVRNVWDVWSYSLAILGAAMIVGGLVANYKQIMATLGKRSTKYITNYAVSVILVIALVAGVNYFGQRHTKRFDLTGIGRFTLAPQTTQVLGKLNQDLDIKAFFPGGTYGPVNELLTEFKGVSRHVRYEFVDPDKNPEIAKQYGVTVAGTFSNPFTGSVMKYGTVVLSYSGRQEKLEKRNEEVKEEDLTNAIIKIQRTETKTIYFVEGHGEKDINDTERGGYAQAKEGLEKEGFKVSSINLASQGSVPADAKVLVLAGPETEPFEKEFEFINEFLNKGGGVLAMVDPSPSASLAPFLKEWQVTPEDDIVLDVSGAGRLLGAGPSIPLVLQYEPQVITGRMKGQMTFFPYARSFSTPATPATGFTVEPLFKSNENSWGEKDLKKETADFDEKTDLKGPLTMAVAVSKEVKPAADDTPAVKARLVVVGDSDFAGIPYFQSQGNGDLFMNMVSWLAQDEDLISIRPKDPVDRKIVLSESQSRMLQLFALVFLPGAVLVTGIVVWTRRRR